MEKPHALVVGGTGMLKPVVFDLIKKYNVSVIGRNVKRLNQTAMEAEKLGGIVSPISSDYENTKDFDKSIKKAVENFGIIELAVVWIHKTSPEAFYVVSKYVGSRDKKGRYIHVLGSNTADPSISQKERREKMKNNQNFDYYEVILGFMIEKEKSRWLKKEEISGGVLKALKLKLPKYVVGTVTPWSAKP